MMFYSRVKPLITDCPKGFYYDDFVETNDGAIQGFVRGAYSLGPSNTHCQYLVLTDSGEVISLLNVMLRLIFRISDPEAREQTWAAYRQNIKL